MLDPLKLLWGLPVLAALLYVPGAVVLNVMRVKFPYSPAFSGRDEWLFTALLISALFTSLPGFVLAQIGIFSWWLTLILALTFAAATVLLTGEGWLTVKTQNSKLKTQNFLSLLALPSPPPMRQTDRREARLWLAGLAAIMLVAAALFSRPAEMLRGALDSGVYINSGIAIGRTGSILQRDILLRQLNDDAGEGRELMQAFNPDRFTFQRIRMPGFYEFDKKASLVLPQHYSLFPVWIGLMYSLFGVWGALYTQPLLALFALLAVYYFARRVLSPGAALLALALLAFCPVIIWFARYPVSEILSLFLVFSGFFAFHRLLSGQWSVVSDQRSEVSKDDDEDKPLALSPQSSVLSPHATLWGMVAGACFGLMSLTRPDFFLYLVPLLPYVAYWRLARRWRPAYGWMLATLGAFLALYAVHFFFFTFGYTVDLYYNVIQNLRRQWSLLLVALYVGLAVALVADGFHSRLRAFWSRLERAVVRYRWVWAWLLVLVIGGYALYSYLIAPWLPNLRFDSAGNPIPQAVETTWSSYTGAPTDEGGRYNLVRIGWYLSPLGIVLGVAGLARFVWGRLSAATGLFFGSLLLMGLVFLPESYTEAHYIYTMRRYVPIILPALILGIAWACHFLWAQLRPRPMGWALGGGAAIAMLVFFVYTSYRVIIPHVEYEGAVAQFDNLASRFPGKSVVLFSNERDEPFVVATPLHYTYGIDSWVVNRPYPQVRNDVLDGIVKRWESQGYKVWVMMSANGGKLDLPNYSLKEEGYWEYAVPEFEQLRIQKPYNTYTTNLPWGIYSLQPRAPDVNFPFTVNIGEMDYPHLIAGFYREETTPTDADKWRWTGPTAILRLPWPTTTVLTTTTNAGAMLTLRARQESPPAQGEPTRPPEPITLTLSLDDTPIGDIVVQPGTEFRDYTLQVGGNIPKNSSGEETALLKIESPTWSPRSAGTGSDARVLGVQLDRVEVMLLEATP